MSKILLSIGVLLGTIAVLAPGQTITPPVPVNLRAELDNMMMGPTPVVKLTWDAPDGPWSYIVFHSDGDSTRFAPLAKTGTRFLYDRAVTMGNIYVYTVRSFVLTPDGRVVESGPSRPAWIDLRTAVGPARGVIAGLVRDDSTGMPVPGIPIRFFRQGPGISPTVVPTVTTDRSGFYKALLDTGSYLINTDPPPAMPQGPPQYQGEWFDDAKE
ncbi:MAG: hypothetical protein H6Q28_1422, partial [Bacteroidetes bacterium]|nr:hypothetical protein [Bacteroidota bacterium]